jgi:hypothetical protein
MIPTVSVAQLLQSGNTIPIVVLVAVLAGIVGFAFLVSALLDLGQWDENSG